jgi:drug/metabolite transporter (DMT)-like permease
MRPIERLLIRRVEGFALGIGSAFAFGTMGFVARAMRDSLAVEEQSFWRAAVGALVLLPVVARAIPALFKTKALSLWVRSFAGAASVLCYFSNLHRASVGDATALRDLAPVFVLLISWGLGESVRIVELIGVAVVLSGAILLKSPFGSDLPFWTVLVGMAGALSAGIAYSALKRATAVHSPVLVVWCFSAVTAVVAAMMPGESWVLPRGSALLAAVSIGALGLLGQLLLTFSLSLLPAATGSALMLLGIVWGAACEAIFTEWRPSLGAVVAYAIIVAGVGFLFKFRVPTRAGMRMEVEN